MKDMDQIKLCLPKILWVGLCRFSLYAANPNAEFQCEDGVICIVGANGIGKSTLLSAINFCLTGIVPDPNRSFESMEEFYKYTRKFSASYFRGRIEVGDEDEAEITIRFNLDNYVYDVRRGMFEPEELRGLSIVNSKTGEAIVDTEGMTRRECQQSYINNFIQHSKVASFEEFVFLQHFVFTFDEQRRTLFFNPRVMDRVLYRAFGLEPDMAKRADLLWREIEQEDSRVRNRQWEATRLRKRLNEITRRSSETSGAQEKFDNLVTYHKELSERFDSQNQEVLRLENKVKDLNLQLAESSMKESSLRDEYAVYFDRHFSFKPHFAQHPLIVNSLKDQVCGLCGNESARALETIQSKVQITKCPLCGSETSAATSKSGEADSLSKIDQDLNIMRKRISDILNSLGKLREELKIAHQNRDKTKFELDDFDRENTDTLDRLRLLLEKGDSKASLEQYRQQLVVLEKEKEEAYKNRETLKVKRLDLQKRLEQQYLDAEKEFVPKFADLAQRFLGMPLTVQLSADSGRDLQLIVSVRGTTRREQQNLSESQRFFLDIALRMALTQHMSDINAKGSMYIDTPEGSLDIAYEKRAGEMLAMFSEAGHQIIMTANLNSSQLLLQLAKRCGRQGLRLCRMTDWAELSEVQKEEELLFETAYNEIEKALDIEIQ